MEWTDEGIVLSVAKYGEHDALVEAMTLSHGRHRGFVKAGMSRRQRGMLQPGNSLKLSWRSRIEENLGNFKTDPIHSPLGSILTDKTALGALTAILAVFSTTLPEREEHPQLYAGLKAYIELLEQGEAEAVDFAVGLVKVEAGVLDALGYGLNLSECAATGAKDDLVFVSPKSGQAVSKSAGEPFKTKMLPLPSFLLDNPVNPITHSDVLSGLVLTGYFLDRYVWAVYGKGQPSARERFIHQLTKKADEI